MSGWRSSFSRIAARWCSSTRGGMAERVAHRLTRAAGRRRRRQPSRQPVARDPPRCRAAAEGGQAQGDRRHGVARDGHRHRLHRPGLPDRLAAGDRHVPAARRPLGPRRRRVAQGAALSADARRAARMPGAGAGRAAAGSSTGSRFPSAPLDILAQQIVAAVAATNGTKTSCSICFRRAWPYRDLTRERVRRDRADAGRGVKPRQQGGRLPASRPDQRPAARPAAARGWRRSPPAGRFPKRPEYRVVTEGEGTFVGTVDEDFAIESLAGDVFLLGNTSWRIRARPRRRSDRRRCPRRAADDSLLARRSAGPHDRAVAGAVGAAARAAPSESGSESERGARDSGRGQLGSR